MCWSSEPDISHLGLYSKKKLDLEIICQSCLKIYTMIYNLYVKVIYSCQKNGSSLLTKYKDSVKLCYTHTVK